MVITIALTLALQTGAPLRLEAENATLAGPRVSHEGSGYSGSGYITNITDPKVKIEWRTKARVGLYEVWVGYRTPGGEKQSDVVVNGAALGFKLEDSKGKWITRLAGLAELKDGDNSFAINRGWGYFDLDFIEFRPTRSPSGPKTISPRLADSQATKEAKKAMAALCATYGKKSWTGTYNVPESENVRSRVKVEPAILGGDLMEYSPSRIAHGSDPKNESERCIAAAQKGQLITLSWHWNAPTHLLDKMITDRNGKEIDAKWYKGFYTNASTFDVEKALNEPKSEEYRLILRDIDAIAKELKKFDAAKVPVLWRPLHEADGKWFWWGAKGAEPCKRLWRLVFDRITNHHQLHNLIWVWNSPTPEWYPGDSLVDVIAVDAYPSDRNDPLWGTWNDLLKRFDGKKLLAIGEFGGVPDPAKMFRFGATWAYWVSWSGSLGPKSEPDDRLRRTYLSPYSVVKK